MVIRGGSGASYLSTAGDITAMIFKSTLFFLLPLLWAANAPEQSSVTESKTLGAGHYSLKAKLLGQDTTRGAKEPLVSAPSERLRRFHIIFY